MIRHEVDFAEPQLVIFGVELRIELYLLETEVLAALLLSVFGEVFFAFLLLPEELLKLLLP